MYIAQVSVRLINPNGTLAGQYQGRVEVRYNSTSVWGTVCTVQWTIEDALVVCRMLGFTSASRAVTNGIFGPGTGDIWLSNVSCVGNEASIANCGFRGWGNTGCTHAQDAGVVCSDGELLLLLFCLFCNNLKMAFRVSCIETRVSSLSFGDGVITKVDFLFYTCTSNLVSYPDPP